MNGWRFALALVIVTCVAYLPVADAGWIWDDDYYVTENEALRSVDGLKRIWTDTSTTPQYYPLTHTSFWLQYQIWELNPAPYHWLNVLLHVAAALWLWQILLALKLPGPRFVALLFALHPVHVESVAWVTERKNVLCGFFFLLAGWLYLRREQPRWSDRLAAFLSYVAALLSKTVAASFPIVLLMVLIWKRRWRRADLTAIAPMLLVGAALGRITARLEKEQVLAVGPEWDFSFIERWLIAGRAVWFYFTKLLLPIDLAFVYRRWTLDAGDWKQWAFLIAAFAVLGGTIVWARKGRPEPLIAGLFFGVCLGPALGFFNVYPMRYSFVADHFQYLASIAPLTLIGGWLAHRFRQPLAAVVVCLFAIVLTFQQATHYRDAETLWRATIETNPQAWMAHHNLAHLLEARGDRSEARDHYRMATDANPGLVEAWVGWGTNEIDLGQPQQALQPLQRAVDLEPANRVAFYNLALAHQRLENYDRAAALYTQLVQQAPDMGAAHYNRAITLFFLNRLDEARAALAAADRLGVRVDPAFRQALTP